MNKEIIIVLIALVVSVSFFVEGLLTWDLTKKHLQRIDGIHEAFVTQISELVKTDKDYGEKIDTLQTEYICLKYGEKSDDCTFVRGLDEYKSKKTQ